MRTFRVLPERTLCPCLLAQVRVPAATTAVLPGPPGLLWVRAWGSPRLPRQEPAWHRPELTRQKATPAPLTAGHSDDTWFNTVGFVSFMASWRGPGSIGKSIGPLTTLGTNFDQLARSQEGAWKLIPYFLPACLHKTIVSTGVSNSLIGRLPTWWSFFPHLSSLLASLCLPCVCTFQ